MPVCLFTIHAHGSWMVDREEGHHDRRKRGLLRENIELGHHHRVSMRRNERVLTETLQRACIEEAVAASEHQRLELFAIGSCRTHLHPLLSWRDERHEEAVRTSLKRSLSLRMKSLGETLPFWSDGGDCFRVHQQQKLDFHRYAYLPDHPGWFYDVERGLRPPRFGQRLVERWRLHEPREDGMFPPLVKA